MKHNNIKLTSNDLTDLENTYLFKYREAIKTGEIKACHYLTKELDNLIEDLSNENYYYDTKDAYRRIDLIQNCFRQTKSPFYGQPFKLELFQLAFIEVFYSFYMSNDNTQRFQKSLFLLARKNGKSMLCSALALAEMIIGNKGSDICCSSNNDNQAAIVVDEIDAMRVMIDPASKSTHRNQRFIKCIFNNSRIRKISERTKNREGLNLDLVIQDEAHELREGSIVKQLEQSQSLKKNPKFVIISTEGFISDGFLQNEIDRAKLIIDKEIEDSASIRYLPFIYEMDSEAEIWAGNKENMLHQKANPLLGIAKNFSYMQQQVDLARSSKTDRAYVLCKDFNLRQSTATAWLKTEDFSYEYEPFDLEDFRGSLCLGAVDIAETTDLTSAKIILTKPKDRKKYIHSMYWIPEGKLERGNDDKNAGAKYTEWAQKGLLRICDGNYLNTSVVADWFLELYKKYGLRVFRVGYDSKFANEFINRMDDYGFETEIIWQRPAVLTRGINMSEVDLQAQNVIGLNEIDKFCLSNATLKTDSQGFSILEKIKGQQSRKIDGAVTLVMAYEMFARYRQVLDNN